MKATIVLFNFDTQESKHQNFEGKDCWLKAQDWIHEDSFLHKDFPKRDGWGMEMIWDDEATKDAEERGAEVVLGNLSLRVPL